MIVFWSFLSNGERPRFRAQSRGNLRMGFTKQ